MMFDFQAVARALPRSVDHLERLRRQGKAPWLQLQGRRLRVDWPAARAYFITLGVDLDAAAQRELPPGLARALVESK